MMLMLTLVLSMVFVYTGKRLTYKHNDLEVWRKPAIQKWQQKLVRYSFITEGVFEMRGQQGKLTEIVAMKPKV
jgi:glycine C-acetyltransferase